MNGNTSVALAEGDSNTLESNIGALLARMTLAEKIGQMNQRNGDVPGLERAVSEGRVGSVLNDVNVHRVNELQRLAVEKTRLGIPLLVGRDVIHGFKTIFPIPLGQAASWNPELIEEGSRIAALEASSAGVNWTFAPMIDITRDPRWGRIAESLGEDSFLASALGAAMVKGFQGDDLSGFGSIAACAKHFAGYGAAESGRDYNTADISENQLRNVFLPPFEAAIEAGAATFMASFSDLNGVPATGSEFLMKQILRDEWGYKGLLVSDWESITQLSVHGFTENDKESAFAAASAGIDMEMASTTYEEHLNALIDEGRISEQQVDAMVANILRAKFKLGLFENPYTDPASFPELVNEQHRHAAKIAAIQSCVLLRNENDALPLNRSALKKLAVIGPLADAPYEQLGTWVFDGDPRHSVTGLQAIRESVGDAVEVRYAQAMATSRTRNRDGFAEAVAIAGEADVAILFLGEESILSGEAHSRAIIDLPGNQEQLIEEIAATGKPIILVVMAGRPLTLEKIVDKVDAILYAWHPGTMGGAAITDLLFGEESPSGKLPVTFPRLVGQIPMYYSHKHTGKPPTQETYVYIDDIDSWAAQTSVGNTSFHLDTHYTPLFPFGFGLSYGDFSYSDIKLSADRIDIGDTLEVSAELTNRGKYAADEIVQLYIRDLVGNVTRPVKELKGFQRIRLEPGASQTVIFELHTDALAFHDRNMQRIVEPGDFHVWVGGNSETNLKSAFAIAPVNWAPQAG